MRRLVLWSLWLACSSPAGNGAVSPNAMMLPAHQIGAFGGYRLLASDAFPGGPVPPPNALGSLSWASSGSRLWSWGFTGGPSGNTVHYLVLHGNPDDAAVELHRRAGAPQPVMPAGARLLYYGNDWGHGKWVFDTVAVDSAPLFTAADLASCKLSEHDNHDASSGSDVVTQRPWLEVRFTEAGQHKLAEAGSGTQGLVIAFGDDALSLAWFPQWTDTSWIASDFAIEGVSLAAAQARASALRDACEEQRKAATTGHP